MGETLTLSWINHHQELVDALWKCFLEKRRVDVEVACQDHVVEAHHLILGSCSPALRKTLEDRRIGKDKDKRPSLRWDIPGEHADLVVEFMYRGEIHITEDKMVGLRKAALDLEFQALLDALNNLKHSVHDAGSTRKGAKKRKGKPIKIPNEKSSTDLGDGELQGSLNQNLEGDFDKVHVLRNGRQLKIQKTSRRATKKIGSGEKFGSIRNNRNIENRNDNKLNLNQEERERRRQAAAERKKRWLAKRPVLRCLECDYETRDKNTFKSHQAKHDPNAERITCEICSKTFRSKDSFRKHVRSHVNPEKLFKCSHCDFSTVQRSTWIQHLAAIHHVDLQGNPLAADIKCPHCESVFLTEYRLRSHVVRKHTVNKSYICPECEYATMSKGEMDRHISGKHRNERPFMCETCGFRSKTRSAFNNHLVTHSGVKPYICDTCGQSYVRKNKLREHLKKHAKEDTNSGLASSQQAVHCCHFCSRLFLSPKEFTDHMQQCHQDRIEVTDGELKDDAKHEDAERGKETSDERTSNLFDSHLRNTNSVNDVQYALFPKSGCYDQPPSGIEDALTLFY